jgi:hypothetical protein
LERGRNTHRKGYKTQFADPLINTLETLKLPEQGQCSPVAETMLDVLGRVETKRSRGPTRLIIFSDLLENSAKFSFFNKGTCYPTPDAPVVEAEAFKKAKIDANKKIVTHIASRKALIRTSDLQVVVFQIHGLYSDQLLDEARKHWAQWFSTLGLPVQWERM